MSKSTPIVEVLKNKTPSIKIQQTPQDNIVADIINEIQKSEAPVNVNQPRQQRQTTRVPQQTTRVPPKPTRVPQQNTNVQRQKAVRVPVPLNVRNKIVEKYENTESESESCESEESVVIKSKKSNKLKKSKKSDKSYKSNKKSRKLKNEKSGKKIHFLNRSDLEEDDLDESPTLIEKVKTMFTSNLKQPLLIAGLVLLFNMPAIDNLLSTYLTFLQIDGKLSLLGLGIKALLAGVVYLIIQKLF